MKINLEKTAFNLSALHCLHVRPFGRLVFLLPRASKMGSRRAQRSTPGASKMSPPRIENEASGSLLGARWAAKAAPKPPLAGSWGLGAVLGRSWRLLVPSWAPRTPRASGRPLWEPLLQFRLGGLENPIVSLNLNAFVQASRCLVFSCGHVPDLLVQLPQRGTRLP